MYSRDMCVEWICLPDFLHTLRGAHETVGSQVAREKTFYAEAKAEAAAERAGRQEAEALAAQERGLRDEATLGHREAEAQVREGAAVCHG